MLRTARATFAIACISLCAAATADEVVITGSIAERVVADAPFAITVVDRTALREAGPMLSLSEALVRVPGLVVNNRANYAQDLQISSRGFGARAGFGVRGMRLYADGIPATGPDGQGQVSHFDLAGAERVEVLRGPYSVLYGNSSGGVIAIVSAPAARHEVEGEADIGSFGLRQLRVAAAAPLSQGFDLRVGASTMETEGFRPRSAAQRELVNVRLGWRQEADQVTLIANYLDQPAQDPLGLSREQFDADARQTTPQAAQFDTRKTARQTQLGTSWRHRFGEGALRDAQVAVYAGQRGVTQWLAIAPATQANVRHGGGVVDFDRDYHGLEARLRWSWSSAELLAGVALDRQSDQRRGYENFTGTGAAQLLGVTGKLRRDEVNSARLADVFAQGEWTISPSLVASAGVRSGGVNLAARDAYLSNGDDSGTLKFRYTNPVLGLRWLAAPGLNIHASAARGFESPTLGELAYRPSGAAGLNDALKAQKSTQMEVGAKWRAEGVQADLSIFESHITDEIGVATNAGGRATFQNIGRTLRRGAELAAAWRPAAGWRTAVSATWLDASNRDGFLTCVAIPCTVATLKIPAGNRIAGTQRGNLWAELAWGEWGFESRAVARTAVNDSNTDYAPRYTTSALRWTHRFVLGESTQLELLARVDNLFDRRYAGSVIVNDGNGRYFETGAPRSALLALRLIGKP